MSFLKKLFGGGKDSQGQGAPAVDAEEEYQGFLIKAMLMRAGGEYQICGTIEKDIDGEVRSYKFIRADKFTNKDDCAQTTLAKGRQIIDEQGKTLFS